MNRVLILLALLLGCNAPKEHPKPAGTIPLSYPFLYDNDLLCDYEVLTDELSSTLGAAAAWLDSAPSLKADVLHAAELAYHMNGSVRGKLAITQEDVSWLKERYDFYYDKTKERTSFFVLPTGGKAGAMLHIARCRGKETVRILYHLQQSGQEVDTVLFDCANMIADWCFTAAMYANLLEGVEEVPFVSKSY